MAAMDDMMPLMTRATERTAELVRAVRQEQFGSPTPCAKFDVKDLINHLEWVAEMFESLGRKGPRVEQGPYAGDPTYTNPVTSGVVPTPSPTPR